VLLQRLESDTDSFSLDRSLSKEPAHPRESNLGSLERDLHFPPSLEHLRGRSVLEAKLLIRPDVLDRVLERHSDAGSTSDGGPVGGSLEVKLLEHGLDRGDEVLGLLDGMTGSRGDSESLLSDSDGREVDGLD
jgi:hypothetical protein